MKIATAAYPIDWHNRWNEYVGKLRVWVRTACEQGAELLVFPEHGALELASLAEAPNAGDLQRAVDAVTARLQDVDGLHVSLAREFGVHICASSAPLRLPDAGIVSRARLFGPDGAAGHQDKLIPTSFERGEWGLVPGEVVRVLETALGRIGILIGNDAAFPLIARAMVAAGAEILLVPSCTGTAQGYWRVRVAAMARAFEGQCVTVQAVTVGDADWMPAAARSVGAAGIFGPPDGAFPEDGIVALGKLDAPGWVYGEVSLEAVRSVRAEGAVRPLAQWAEQDARLDHVEVVRTPEAGDHADPRGPTS